MSMITNGGGELIERIVAANRAMVFISVPWSVPERHARQAFEEVVNQFEPPLSLAGIECFRLEVDEDQVAQEWLEKMGHPDRSGAGNLLWLEQGKVIDAFEAVLTLGQNGILNRTNELWGFA